MNKQEFISRLRVSISGLPQNEIEERLAFYSEMIDDRTEDGLSEEEAIEAIGSVEDVAAQIVAEIPLAKLVKDKIKPKRRLRAWEIVLIAVGAPVWLPLMLAAFVVFLSLYVVIWSVVISFWAVFASVAVSSLACILLGAVLIVSERVYLGIAAIGAGLFCAGLSIFIFFGCAAATKGTAYLTKKIIIGIKNSFVKKEEEQ